MTIIPLVEEMKLAGNLEEVFAVFKDDPHPFWLDSSRGGGSMGRWSFMGSHPFLVLRSFGDRVVVDEYGQQREFKADPFTVLRTELSRFRIERNDLPFPFLGGAVGFFSYDLGRMIETMPASAHNDLTAPDIYLGFYGVFLVIDHVDNRAYLVGTGLPSTGEEGQRQARADLARLRARLLAPRQMLADPWLENNIAPDDIKTFFTRQTYGQSILQIKEYIAAGDIYQANMTQRFDAPLAMPPYQLYRRLRQVNPAPFAAYLDCGDGLAVLSSSPERFLRVAQNIVEARPIKGTRPRGKTPEEDRAQREELLASEKDRAELMMIVDLERNDLGRVCAYGSVQVPELFVLEEYATVFHLVSTVRGELAQGRDIVDLLRATFPGGSITGAPKIRAMEIIEELEPVRRGIYTGSLGYIAFDGRADLNIVIRTFVRQNNMVYLQVGGGIVADSDPMLEYEETLHKAKALLRSLGVHSFAAGSDES